MNLHELDKLVCCVLDRRDVQFISKFEARMRYGRDVAKLRTSRRRLISAIQSFDASEDAAREIHDRARRAGLDSHFQVLSSKRSNLFKRTRLYQSSMPYMLTYYMPFNRDQPLPPSESEHGRFGRMSVVR